MNEIDLLLANLDQAYGARAWHGTNLRGSLRGLAMDVVAYRPQPGRHNVWELAVHCAYWKYAVRRRLTGEKRGSFPLDGSNFFARPDAGDGAATQPASNTAWKRDLALLHEMHTALREVVAELPAKRLGAKPKGSRFSIRDTVLGIAAHDLYHAGQIQLLKRMASG